LNGCLQSTNVAITDIPGGMAQIINPVIDASCNGACDGSIKATMNGGVTPFIYLWSDGQTTSEAVGLCAGTYSVMVTDANGCISTVGANLAQPLQVAFSTSVKPASCYGVCDGIAVAAVTGTIVPYTYLWDVSTGSQTSDSAKAICPGTYAVTITDGDGCSVTANVVVTLNLQLPTAEFISSDDTTSLLMSTIDFTNISLPSLDTLSYQWDFGDGELDSVVHPTHTYSDTGTFTVQLIATNSVGCRDTIEYIIVIEGDYILFAPNTFSPNGDGLNDYFFPQGLGIDNNDFEFYIFNRWGDQIFKSDDILNAWDGRANNGLEIAQEDVYVWLVLAREASSGIPHQYVGHVTIIR